MAKTDTEIVRLALAAAGASKLPTDLATDKSPEVGVMRDLLPQFRDELLEAFDWHFARRRAVLAPLANVTRSDWAFVYAVPADMLTAISVVLPGVRQPRAEDLIVYRLEAGDPPDAPAEDDPFAGEPDSLILLCDQQDAELIYTGRVTNPTRFSASFTGALSSWLAYHAATYMTKKADLAKLARDAFFDALGRAQVHVRKQATPNADQPPDFLEGYSPVSDPSDRLARLLAGR
jgi:hypothetical protein